ncbi:MAG: hypothetical protein KAJ40_06935 [Alphaproteobacteria bacterium]|nr:hypothetical protein [Alphaproteobacteria bacterium]
MNDLNNECCVTRAVCTVLALNKEEFIKAQTGLTSNYCVYINGAVPYYRVYDFVKWGEWHVQNYGRQKNEYIWG